MLPFKIKNMVFCERGLALIEFAIVLPVLILLAYGAYEVNRFININQKLESTTFQLADMITNNRTLTKTDVDSFMKSAQVIMKPYDAQGIEVIITSIHQPAGGVPTTAWQQTLPAGLSSSQISSGVKGSPATVNYPMVDLDQLVAVEIYYPYETLLNINYVDPSRKRNREFIKDDVLYKSAIARARFGALLDLL